MDADAPSRHTGRHRTARSLPGPLALAVLVGAVLLAFGVGAALLRPNLAGGGDAGVDRTASERTDEAGGTGGFGEAIGAPANTETTPPAATPKPTPTASAKAKPRTATSPTPRSSPSRATTRPATGGGGNSTAQSADENEVVAITNQERAAAGCGAVKVNSKLAEAAQLHSQDQAEHNNMSHTGSNGSTPWQRSEDAGYRNAIGENVAMGYRSPEAVMDGWMHSAGHKANILNCDAKAIGVGVAYASDGSPYWTQMFGSVV